MTDAHCHLVDSRYSESELAGIVTRANEAGVDTIISNGTSIENTKETIRIAEKSPGVWATAGMHPDEKEDYFKNKGKIKDLLLKLAENPKVVAIGEAALDFREGITDEEKRLQKEMFELQLQVAAETGLPLVVHNRNADEEVWNYLTDFKQGVQLHCFVESWEYAQKALSKNYYLSFGGIITFKKSEYLREILKKTPETNILMETDAPYLAPEPVRGSINEPKNVKIVAELAGKIRSTSIDQIEEATDKNARKLFKKMTQ